MAGPFAQHAIPLILNGISPLPIIAGSKKPALKCWQRCCITPLSADYVADYARRRPHAQLGVALGYRNTIATDIDVEDEDIKAAIGQVLPRSIVEKTGMNGWTSFYRSAVPMRTARITGKDGRRIVDFLAHGSQTLIPGSVHPVTRKPYRWLTSETLLTVTPGDLAELPADILDQLYAVLEPWARPRRPLEPVKVELVAADLDELAEKRHKAWATKRLEGAALLLSNKRKPGRGDFLYAMSRELAPYISRSLLDPQTLTEKLFEASEINGFARDDGPDAVRKNIERGLAHGRNDDLPKLQERPR